MQYRLLTVRDVMHITGYGGAAQDTERLSQNRLENAFFYCATLVFVPRPWYI